MLFSIVRFWRIMSMTCIYRLIIGNTRRNVRD